MDNILRVLLVILIWVSAIAKLKREKGWYNIMFTAITASCLSSFIGGL